jgi:hypothetical protein
MIKSLSLCMVVSSWMLCIHPLICVLTQSFKSQSFYLQLSWVSGCLSVLISCDLCSLVLCLIFESPPCGPLISWLSQLIPPLFCKVLAAIQPNFCHGRFLLDCMFGNGVLVNDWWCRDETESPLWRPTHGCAARHALVSLLLAMIHYRTTPRCHLIMSLSLIIYLDLIRRSLLHVQVRELPMKLQRG